MKITRKDLTEAQKQVTPDKTVNDILAHVAVEDAWGVISCKCGLKRCPELEKKQRVEGFSGQDML